MRVGIHSGMVVAGLSSGTGGEPDVVGATSCPRTPGVPACLKCVRFSMVEQPNLLPHLGRWLSAER